MSIGPRLKLRRGAFKMTVGAFSGNVEAGLPLENASFYQGRVV
jgi:hypothetical protein